MKNVGGLGLLTKQDRPTCGGICDCVCHKTEQFATEGTIRSHSGLRLLCEPCYFADDSNGGCEFQNQK